MQVEALVLPSDDYMYVDAPDMLSLKHTEAYWWPKFTSVETFCNFVFLPARNSYSRSRCCSISQAVVLSVHAKAQNLL